MGAKSGPVVLLMQRERVPVRAICVSRTHGQASCCTGSPRSEGSLGRQSPYHRASGRPENSLMRSESFSRIPWVSRVAGHLDSHQRLRCPHGNPSSDLGHPRTSQRAHGQPQPGLTSKAILEVPLVRASGYRSCSMRELCERSRQGERGELVRPLLGGRDDQEVQLRVPAEETSRRTQSTTRTSRCPGRPR